jgi:UDP-N-acetylmuramoyl-L-alanyl-D-glutamate--2,6-diaminopimelate ligase
VDPVELIGAEDISVGGCHNDPEQIRPGDVFVSCCQDPKYGRMAAFRAVCRGASAVVTDEPLPELRVPQCLVENPRAAYATLCHALAGQPSQLLDIVGILGGRVGQATIRFLQELYKFDALSSESAPSVSKSVFVPGSYAYDPRRLAQRLANLADSGIRRVFLELPPRAIAEGHTAGVEFDVLCLGGGPRCREIPQEDLRPKGAVARLLQQIKPTGLAIVACNNPLLERLLDWVDVPALSVAVEQPAEISATVVATSLFGQTVLIRAGQEATVLQLRIVGRDTLLGALVAGAVALIDRFSLVEVARSLERVPTVPGCLERICCGQPFAILADIPSHPAELEEILQQLRPLVNGRLLCVAALESLIPNPHKEPLLGQPCITSASIAALAGWADALFLYPSVSDQNEAFRSRWKNLPIRRKGKCPLTKHFVAGNSREKTGKVCFFPAEEEALRVALASAETNDLVLIVGQHARPADPLSKAADLPGTELPSYLDGAKKWPRRKAA